MEKKQTRIWYSKIPLKMRFCNLSFFLKYVPRSQEAVATTSHVGIGLEVGQKALEEIHRA